MARRVSLVGRPYTARWDDERRGREPGIGHAIGGREDGSRVLRCSADVAMMQAADLGHFYDSARLGELHGPDVPRILVEREMRASSVVVNEVVDQNSA